MTEFWTYLESGPGLAVILWFQSWRTDVITALFQPFNWAGTETFFLVLLTLVYWTISKPVGRRLTVVFLVSAWLNSICKLAWQRPRPFQVSGKVMPPYSIDGYGLPSGHTQTATTVAAVFLAETRKRWGIILLLLYMFLMGISRMVHGVHYPQDVVLGWIIGILIAVILLKLESVFKPFLAEMSLGRTLLIMFVVTVVMLGLAFSVTVDPRSLAGMITPAAVLAGAVPGFFIETGKVRFSTRGSIGQRCLRYLVGIITALLIKEGLKPVLGIINDQSLFMEVLVRFVRYFLMGIWISAGAPWLFTRIRLAGRES